MRPRLKRRIAKKYKRLLDNGVDPHVAKLKILKMRVQILDIISYRRLANLLSEMRK